MSAPCAQDAARGSGGFSLLEVCVALALTAIVISATIAFALADTVLTTTVPHAVDVQQRGRAVFALVQADLAMAGAGADAGPRSGPLAAVLPPLVPRRVVASGGDSVSVARADAFSVLYVPGATPTMTTTVALAGDAPTLTIAETVGCPAAAGLCGLANGATLLVFDETGRHAVYTARDVSDTGAALTALQAASPSFAPGAVVVPAVSRVYTFDAASHQLRRRDGASADVAVVDDVVDLSVEYWGDPRPPIRPKPPVGVSNCLYDTAGHVSVTLPTLAAEGSSLAPLPLGMLADGPWCGEGGRQYDVDLLRVRFVRVRVRLQASLDQFRLIGPAYRLPGLGGSPVSAVPDLDVTIGVMPVNLNLGR